MAMTGGEWRDKLSMIGDALAHSGQEAEICIIGGVACMLDGMDARKSFDCDIFVPRSKFSSWALEKATRTVGLDFNPTNEDPQTPYLQLITPGIVQIGKFSDKTVVAHTGGLTVSVPPPENLIASKLLRCSPKDLEDIAFLLAKHPSVKKDDVYAAIKTLPGSVRGVISENSVFLDVLSANSPYTTLHGTSNTHRQARPPLGGISKTA